MTDVLEIERLGWNEALHPRQGGKFAPKGTATGKAAAPAGKSRMGGGGHDSNEGLSFNGRTGAGYGKKGGDNRVSALQSELNRLGFADGSGKALKKDGKLGPRTTAAIKRAQKALGLKADGIATPRLLAKLKAGKKTVAHKSGGHRKSMPVRPHAGKAAPAGKNPAPAKKTATPAKRPTFAKQASPPPSARKAGPVKRDVSRAASLSYSVRMTEALRHQPGGHNQQSHANRLGRPSNLPGKTGLGKVAGKLKDDPEQGPALPPKTRKLSHTDVRTALVGEDAHIGKGASRKVEDHRALLMDAGASREHADEILKDLGANPDRDYETFDAGYATYNRVDNEKKTAAIEERKAFLAGKTPEAFARLLGTDGQPALVKSKPVAKVFEAMQAAGWTITGAGHGSYTFQSPDESKKINVIAINGVTIYDHRHNKISGVKALAYVQGGP